MLAQYRVEPELLAPYLPAGTELDFYQTAAGERLCVVSLVGFRFLRVRVLGIPFPLHTSFDEVNLRFYVRRREPDGTLRRGVVFISELVPRHAIAWVAKGLYEEPYRAARMRHRIHATASALHVRYDWKLRGRWHSMAAEAAPAAQPLESGSEAEFILEHYWGYTRRTRGATSAYQVSHPRWNIYPVQSFNIDADFGRLYGSAFSWINPANPHSVILAEGSAVSVSTGSRLH